MTTDNIIAFLLTHKKSLHSDYHVKDIALFGSYARREEKQGSDVDLLVELDGTTLDNLYNLRHYLESELKLPIDITLTSPSSKPRFIKQIESELIHV